MVLPLSIGQPSPLDASLVLPIPKRLPTDPTLALETLSAAINAQLDPSAPSSSKLPIPVITAQMRLIHRNAQVLMNAARAGTAEARAELDAVDVDLRTVEYERDRVRDEINRCAEYA
jgi:THO complex subunit 5